MHPGPWLDRGSGDGDGAGRRDGSAAVGVLPVGGRHAEHDAQAQDQQQVHDEGQPVGRAPRPRRRAQEGRGRSRWFRWLLWEGRGPAMRHRPAAVPHDLPQPPGRVDLGDAAVLVVVQGDHLRLERRQGPDRLPDLGMLVGQLDVVVLVADGGVALSRLLPKVGPQERAPLVDRDPADPGPRVVEPADPAPVPKGDQERPALAPARGVRAGRPRLVPSWLVTRRDRSLGLVAVASRLARL